MSCFASYHSYQTTPNQAGFQAKRYEDMSSYRSYHIDSMMRWSLWAPTCSPNPFWCQYCVKEVMTCAAVLLLVRLAWEALSHWQWSQCGRSPIPLNFRISSAGRRGNTRSTPIKLLKERPHCGGDYDRDRTLLVMGSRNSRYYASIYKYEWISELGDNLISLTRLRPQCCWAARIGSLDHVFFQF